MVLNGSNVDVAYVTFGEKKSTHSLKFNRKSVQLKKIVNGHGHFMQREHPGGG